MDIIPLDPSRKKQAAALYARAFFNYPQFVSYLPDQEWRTRYFAGFVEAWINYVLRYGQADTTPDLTGLACWLPPGKTHPSNWGFILTGSLSWVFRIGWKTYARMAVYEDHAEKIHQTIAPGPHWYLWGLAVDPTCQGKGIGTRLMQPVLNQANQQGLPCYLETHKAENVPFYEKNGFQVVHSQASSSLGIPFWCMLRTPGS